jgi:hypothetical protein
MLHSASLIFGIEDLREYEFVFETALINAEDNQESKIS